MVIENPNYNPNKIKYYSIKIEFYEQKPPHSRQILSNQIGILFDSFETKVTQQETSSATGEIKKLYD